MNALRISTLRRNLLEEYVGDPPHGRKLREGAVDAKFPAHQVNGLWHYDPADLPVIAAAYGLAPKVQTARKRQTGSTLVAA